MPWAVSPDWLPIRRSRWLTLKFIGGGAKVDRGGDCEPLVAPPASPDLDANFATAFAGAV